MAEQPDVSVGEIASADYHNDLRDRTVQRYADAADRTALNPTPSDGDLAWLTVDPITGGADLSVFVASSGNWHVVPRSDVSGNINLNGRNFLTTSPGEFIGPGAVRNFELFNGNTPVGSIPIVHALTGFTDINKMTISLVGRSSNSTTLGFNLAFHTLSATSITVDGEVVGGSGGNLQYRLTVVEYY